MVKLYEGASVTKHIAEYTDAYIVNAETGSYIDIEEASVTKHTAEHTNANILGTKENCVTDTVKDKPWFALFGSSTQGSQSCTWVPTRTCHSQPQPPLTR